VVESLYGWVAGLVRLLKSRAKQSIEAKLSKAKQSEGSKAKQRNAEQNKVKQRKAKQNKST
jgi:hypothetical protein